MRQPSRAIEDMPPFARLLAEYMIGRGWPPMSAPEFAALTQVSVQSVYNYLLKDVLPRAETIDQIALTTGLDREALYHAASLLLPGKAVPSSCDHCAASPTN